MTKQTDFLLPPPGTTDETKLSRRRRRRREKANQAAEEELAEISLEQQWLKSGLTQGNHKELITTLTALDYPHPHPYF